MKQLNYPLYYYKIYHWYVITPPLSLSTYSSHPQPDILLSYSLRYLRISPKHPATDEQQSVPFPSYIHLQLLSCLPEQSTFSSSSSLLHSIALNVQLVDFLQEYGIHNPT